MTDTEWTAERINDLRAVINGVGVKASRDWICSETLCAIAAIQRLQTETENLKHDIARHVEIASTLATENAQLRKELGRD